MKVQKDIQTKKRPKNKDMAKNEKRNREKKTQDINSQFQTVFHNAIVT